MWDKVPQVGNLYIIFSFILEGGGGGRHVTHSSHNSTYVLFFYFFIRNVPKRIISWNILILTFIDYVDL